MTPATHQQLHTFCTLRVLVVENDGYTREDYRENLARWGYTPILAEGGGTALLDDAERKARLWRCQVALVDMRLMDDHDPHDWSGLELIARLQPAATIIVSGFGNREAARNALIDYHAADFVGKEEGPQRLRAVIEAVARKSCACRYLAAVNWPHGLSSPMIIEQLFPTGATLPIDEHVPPDEADELIARLFPEARTISLDLITGPINLTASESALRRRSLVFKARIDDWPSFQVVKVSRHDKIKRELHNYYAHVQHGLSGMYRPELRAHTLLWDLGAVAYSFVGNGTTSTRAGPMTFASLYRSNTSARSVLRPLRHYFGNDNWGAWLTTSTPLETSLFEAYDQARRDALSRHLDRWGAQGLQREFPLVGTLPNPLRWLHDHHAMAYEVPARQAVTHGDLHGDNLFVDRNGTAWAIDFEYTGTGPRLRDAVELIHDILTRLVRLPPQELPLLYDLAVAICAPAMPGQAVPLPRRIQSHPELARAFEVVQAILRIIQRQTRYTDQRELLWALLLNSVLVATIVPEQHPRQHRTALLAAVVAGRLDHWNRADWPPRGWPDVAWR